MKFALEYFHYSIHLNQITCDTTTTTTTTKFGH